MARVSILGIVLWATNAMGAEPPSLEFLDFLGEWQGADGEAIDPAALDSVDPTVTDETAIAPAAPHE
jgi:hypothetical protein